MNWDKVKENWPEARHSAKEKWPKLSEAELDRIGGDRTPLMEKLVEQYGRSLEEAALEVDRWAEQAEAAREAGHTQK